MHIFHDWNKWQEYEKTYDFYPRDSAKVLGNINPIRLRENWQKRTCKICGFTQDRKIDDA